LGAVVLHITATGPRDEICGLMTYTHVLGRSVWVNILSNPEST
jgi:hypothetical protein